MEQADQSGTLLGGAQIAAGAALYGLITVGGKYFSNLGFSLYEIALLIAFVPLALAPLLVFKAAWRPEWASWVFFVGFGLIGGLLQIFQFAGVVLGVPVAVVALLLYSQPIWTTVLGRALLGESITARKLAAVSLALLGILLLVDLDAASLQGVRRQAGVVAALAAGLLLSLWVIWGRRSGLKQRHFVGTTFGYGASSTAWLLAFGLLDPTVRLEASLTRFDPSVYIDAWLSVALYTLLAGVLPACLVFAGMRSVEASSAGVLMLLEPVSAAFGAHLLFGEPLTSNVWLGGICILAANAIAISRPRPRRAP